MSRKYYKIISGTYSGLIGFIEKYRNTASKVVFYPIEDNAPCRIIKNKSEISEVYNVKMNK